MVVIVWSTKDMQVGVAKFECRGMGLLLERGYDQGSRGEGGMLLDVSGNV